MSQPLYPSFTLTYHHKQYPTIDPTQPALDYSDKIVLITGGGRGIGQAIAIAFAKAHAKGIALLGRTKSTLDDTLNQIRDLSPETNVFVAVADITNQTEVQTALDDLIAHYSGTVPNVLINNAGGVSCSGPIIDLSIPAFTQDLNLNVLGPLIVTQTYLRSVRTCSNLEQPRTVLNISTGAAHLPYAPNSAAYACSKLAFAKMTEYLHHEVPKEWRVYNIQPGVVNTDLTRRGWRKAEDEPELVGGLGVWLATQGQRREEARCLNGKFLWANWDVDELLERREEIERRGLLTLTLKGWAEEYNAEDLRARAASVCRDAEKEG